jgi:hypothetical protein
MNYEDGQIVRAVVWKICEPGAPWQSGLGFKQRKRACEEAQRSANRAEQTYEVRRLVFERTERRSYYGRRAAGGSKPSRLLSETVIGTVRAAGRRGLNILQGACSMRHAAL